MSENWYPIEWSATVRLEPRDIWIGVYWNLNKEKEHWWNLQVYVCVIPLFPLCIGLFRHVKP